MRRLFFLLVIPVFSLAAQAARPDSTPLPADFVKAIPIRPWYDTKASVTHVELLQEVSLPATSGSKPISLGAGFDSDGYRTDPPEFVILSFDGDHYPLLLVEVQRSLGAFHPRAAKNNPPPHRTTLHALPPHPFQPYISREHPAYQAPSSI